MIFIATGMALAACLTTALAAPTQASAPLPNFSLVAEYRDRSFFDGFTAFTGADPTGGRVRYVGLEEAAQKNYTGFHDNKSTKSINAYIGVDHTSVTPYRDSVRLSSKHTFDVGSIVVMDVVHMPSAFGAWPALWLLGDNPGGRWPDTNGGEIDILEVVHNGDVNAMTMHTGPGCTVDKNAAHLFQGQLQDPNCNAGSPQPGTTGCSVQATNQASSRGVTLATAGAPFNQQEGGVYVTVWMESGVSVYLFKREALPSGLYNGNPMPELWLTKPLAHFSGPGCDYGTTFNAMRIVTDTTFCGDWAGKVWDAFGGPAATGSATCEAYVQNNPGAFKDAYFEIKSIQVYGRNGKMPALKAASKREEFAFADIDLAERYRDSANVSMANGTYLGQHGHGHGHGTHSHFH
ncbi:hypothetical protein LTR56_010929 [Elasticomyces elasticus]|nr:hypothetical protein LTR56_010929 [Elasticomyces elasticus]KAK3662628.1 hypothetical protein LTR22_006478 [Elasticomyces elasticus]KAK4926588.1 hypothetical protein LTR49_006522 [Elasticomyces elasticus]KAK5760681.1 hypothetical protein LTS12_009218 [Elasticomyces elasticus]